MTAIEITFLGTTAGIPTKQRCHSAIYVKYRSKEEWCCLWDCGEGTQRQIISSGWLNFMRIDDIFISHWHADHFAGLLGLIETMGLENRQNELRIYAPEASRFVDTLLSLGYSTKAFPVRAVDVEFRGSQISTVLDLPEFSIQSIPMRHGIPAVAYMFVEKDRIKIDKQKAAALGLPPRGKIFQEIKESGKGVWKGKEIKLEQIAKIEHGKRVVYSGDTVPNPNMLKFAQGADLLIHDCTYLEAGEWSSKHPILYQVLELAKSANVKQLILTHISRRYTDIKEIEEKISAMPNVRLAKDFMRVVV